MKNIKEYNKKDILLKILIGSFSGAIFIRLLIPAMYFIFMKLLGISVNLLSGLLMGGSVLGIVGMISLVTKCITVKTEYKFESDIEIDPNMMREQLRIVESKDNTVNKENSSDKKYSYLFDNNYMDVVDIEIDDIMNPNWRNEFSLGDVIDDIDDSDVKIYIRKK